MTTPADQDEWKPGLYTLDEFSGPVTFDPDPHETRTPDPTAVLQETDAACFICKTPLFRSETPNQGNYSREDVFPNLETAFLDYPDGRSFRYEDILVPCCQPCNNEWMSDVEKRIGRAAKAPDQYTEFEKLSRSDLALWSIKIMYGLLWTRIAPWNFKKHKPRPPEITDTVCDQFRVALMLLDGFRKRVVLWGSAFPNSILILRIKPGATGKLAYDYRDSIEFPTGIAMRIGTVGLISTFEDFGVVQNWFDNEIAPIIGNNALHPVQFMEIAARAFDTASMGSYNVAYSVITGPRDLSLQLKPRLAHARPLNEALLYARIAQMTREKIFLDPPAGATSLRNKNGDFLEIPWPTPATRPPTPPA
jgi:hypothetical protein